MRFFRFFRVLTPFVNVAQFCTQMRPHILYEVGKIVLYTVYPRYQLKGPLGEDNRGSERIFSKQYELLCVFLPLFGPFCVFYTPFWPILCILYPFLAHSGDFIPLFGPFWGFYTPFWPILGIFPTFSKILDYYMYPCPKYHLY